mmetsp:Transcript_36286/g.102238  ORF Transcript_36286/g.102238 Transcript_36286/m.102238 type:complete len:86 (+) Transcript_36286:313-570(+)
MQLHFGLGWTFFSKATGTALRARGIDGLRQATANYKMIRPPKNEDALQQGGTYVFAAGECLYARRDGGTGDHAPMEEVLAACSAA